MRTLSFLVLTALFVSLAPLQAGAEQAPTRRFSFVAGANDGGSQRVRLRYAGSDAQSVARVLGELGGVDETDQLLLLEPDRASLQRGFMAMSQRLREATTGGNRVELFFYYSGHSDDEGLLLGQERFGYDELRQALDELPAEVRVAILDSCSSGAFTRRKGGVARPPFLIDAASSVKGHAFLTASSADEAAQESDRIGASYFTHHLVSGLRGAADTSGQGRVTLNEAYAYAFRETLSQTERTQHGAQHPAYEMQLVGSGDLVITDLRSTSAGLIVDANLSGRIFVRDASGNLVVEVRKQPELPLELGLSPGAYSIVVDDKGSLFETELTLVDGRRAALDRSALRRVKGEATVRRGDEGIRYEDYEIVPFSTSMLPEVGDRRTLTRFGLHLVGGRTSRLEGTQLSLGINMVDESMEGSQLTLGANIVGDAVDGAQVAIGMNSAGGSVLGAQASIGANVAGGSVHGAQTAIGFNSASGSVDGVQASIGFNNAAGSVDGLQAAIGANVAGGDVSTGQAAVGMNFAKGGAEGFQLAVGSNVAGGSIEGVQSAVGANLAGGSVDGIQASVGANVAGGSVEGGQLAVGVNLTEGSTSGLQLAVGGNYTRCDFSGIQSAVFGNLALGSFEGLQTSVGFNLVRGDLEGVQAAVGASIVAGRVDGIQAATGFSYARRIDGLQLSLVNVSGGVDGAQIGLVNIGGKVDGAQIGLLNFADESDASIGILSFVRKGRFQLELSSNDVNLANLGLKTGSRNVFGILTAGLSPRGDDPKTRWTTGLGLGVRFDFADTFLDFIDADITVNSIRDGATWKSDNLLNVLRVGAGWQLAPRFALTVGPTLNVYTGFGGEDRDDLGLVPGLHFGGDNPVRIWPGFFASVQI